MILRLGHRHSAWESTSYRKTSKRRDCTSNHSSPETFGSIHNRSERRSHLGVTLGPVRKSISSSSFPTVRGLALRSNWGENVVDEAAVSLLRMAAKIDHDRHGEPAALIVITGGRYSYKRADGVCVVPITALGP